MGLISLPYTAVMLEAGHLIAGSKIMSTVEFGGMVIYGAVQLSLIGIG